MGNFLNREQKSPATLTSIFINDGLSDIETNKNSLGVARNLMSIILSYRTYECWRTTIDAGYLPDIKGYYDIDYALYVAAKRNNKQHIDCHISLLYQRSRWPFDMFKHPNNVLLTSYWPTRSILRGAARGGHRELIDFAIMYGANDYTAAMFEAIHGGHNEIVKFFIEKGVDLDEGMGLSIKLNNRLLIDLFIEKGASHWNYYTVYAIENQNEELTEFFKSKGVDQNKINRVIRYLNRADCVVRYIGLFTIKHLL